MKLLASRLQVSPRRLPAAGKLEINLTPHESAQAKFKFDSVRLSPGIRLTRATLGLLRVRYGHNLQILNVLRLSSHWQVLIPVRVADDFTGPEQRPGCGCGGPAAACESGPPPPADNTGIT